MHEGLKSRDWQPPPPHLFSEITFVFQFKITNAAFHNYSPRIIEKIKFIIFFSLYKSWTFDYAD